MKRMWRWIAWRLWRRRKFYKAFVAVDPLDCPFMQKTGSGEIVKIDAPLKTWIMENYERITADRKTTLRLMEEE